MNTKRLSVAAVVLTAFSGCSSGTESQPVDSIESRAGENYQSIEAFFRNMEYIQSMQLLVRETHDDPDEKLDALKRLASKVLEEDRRIDETKLDAIYPSWGTTYKRTFAKGINALNQGLDQESKADFAMSDSYLAEWDTWWRDHDSEVFLALNQRFGFEVK
jgi:hypothetical protein